MNNLRNRVQLIGNLGADVETQTFDNGRKLAKLRLATKDVYRNKAGEKVTDTQWHNVVAWGKDAETLAVYGKKGNELAINGKLRHDTYQDKDGNTRYTTEVVVQEFMLLR